MMIAHGFQSVKGVEGPALALGIRMVLVVPPCRKAIVLEITTGLRIIQV